MSDNTEKLERRKLTRSTIACNHCNERRVRCDVSTRGLPCSNCHRRKFDHCELIKSKRTRGRTGRFVASATPANKPAPEACPPSSASPGSVADKRPLLKTEAPDFVFDFKNLIRSGGLETCPSLPSQKQVQEPNSPISVPVTIGQDGHESNATGRPSYPGESWYLSFILHNTNNGLARLHQPLKNKRRAAGQAAASHTHLHNKSNPTGPQGHAPDQSAVNDLPDQETKRLLINAYFTRFHEFCPIIDKAKFLRDMKLGKLSVLLLRSVLFVATIHCDAKIFHRLGYDNRNEAGDHFFRMAKADFDAGVERDRLMLLQISFLLHYWWGRPTSFTDSTWWLSGAINAAQSMGMNRSARGSQMAPECRRLWRRTWWLLYIRDVQVSLSLGKPMMINDNDCDIEELEMADFWDESKATALYILSQARLSKAASRLSSDCFSPSVAADMSMPARRHEISATVETALGQWARNLPQEIEWKCGKRNHYLTLGLYINYHYYRIIFHQKLQRASNDRLVGSDDAEFTLSAATSITALVEEICIDSEPFHFPMTCVSAIFASMTVQFVESHGQDEERNEMLQRQLRSNLFGLRQFEEHYSLAGWIRSLFAGVVWGSQRQSPAMDTGSQGTELAPSLTVAEPAGVVAESHFLMQPGVHYEVAALVPASNGTTALMAQTENGRDLGNNSGEMEHAWYGDSRNNKPPESYDGMGVDVGALDSPNGSYINASYFETVQHLADLGMAGFNDYNWDFSQLTQMM